MFFKIFNSVCFEIYVNHKISLWHPTNIEIVYRYSFGEGEDFYILNYDNEKDIKRIIKKIIFKRLVKII